jgi:hypothetical protein
MGNPVTNGGKATDEAALRYAGKVDGEAMSPATPTRALGAQRAIAHERALYDLAVKGKLSDVAGGSALTYDGTIVPENPQEGQITEARFLRLLADEFARRLVGVGMGDGPDPEFIDVVHGMLEKFFAILVPDGTRMERVLRAAVGLPAGFDKSEPPGTFVSAAMSLLTPLFNNLELIMRLAEQLEHWESARSESDYEEAATKLFLAAGILWFPPTGGKAVEYSFRRFTQKVGNVVHTLMQAHYWLTHPNDVLMFEDFIVAGPNLLATIWQAGTWKAPYDFMPLLRAALMSSPRPGQDTGSTKRPDILNLTQAHIYEIKPIAQAQDGVRQVAGYYQRLSPDMPNLHLAGLAPTDWRPFPVYYAGGTTMVLAEVFAPGVITYQRIGTPVPVTNPLRFWSEEKQKHLERQAARAHAYGTVALVAACFVGCLVLAAALVPAAIAAGAAIGGGASAGGATAATELAIASGLAYAL